MGNSKLSNKQVHEIWDYFVGSKKTFALEHRVFNSVCLLAMAMLAAFIPFNYFLGLRTVSLLFLATGCLCGFVYYVSRFRGSYSASTTIFCIVSLLVLSANYFLNDGISGPTVLGFFLCFQFIIAIKPPRTYWFWVMLHAFIVLGLYLTEGYYPGLVTHTYASYQVQMVDNFATYVVVLVLTFFTINFIRRNYHYEKLSAERRAEAIETQHLQIAAQHLQLERLNQEKNKMFSIISHDLKSPLDSIRSYLELLSQDLVGADERKDFEKHLLMVTSNTSELLQNLLSWSKSQMDGTTAKLVPLNLYHVLHSSLDVQETVAENKGIRLTYSIDDSIEVVADHDMLQLVVRNLISNAIKFTRKGGSIQVKTFIEDSHCKLAIKDSGLGIQADKQSDIFTLKTHSTYGTGNEKGVGLGLVLCKEFTELQGGRIWFESQESEGTTFYLLLPVKNETQMSIF